VNARRTRRRYFSPRSRRSLDRACRLAGLPVPQHAAELGEVFLMLLVQGIDHLHVGQEVWFRAMLDAAPREREAP
jgi:hypothetical protein